MDVVLWIENSGLPTKLIANVFGVGFLAFVAEAIIKLFFKMIQITRVRPKHHTLSFGMSCEKSEVPINEHH